MLPKLKMLVLKLKKMCQRGREILLLVGNLLLQCEGDLPLHFEEAGHLEDYQILLYVDVLILLFAGELILLTAGVKHLREGGLCLR